jgi:Domain of unknown function (DUF4303)
VAAAVKVSRVMSDDLAAELTTALTTASRRAFTAVRRRRPDEVLYCYALYTDGAASYIVPTCGGERALREAAGPDPRAIEELRWSPCDWPYHELGTEEFADVDRILAARPDPYDDDAGAEASVRFDACFEALAGLDAESFFGCGAERDSVIVTVLQGDQSDSSRLANARRLNPPAAVERLTGQSR